MNADAALVKLLLAVADVIEGERFPASAGVVRVAARRITELSPTTEEGCVSCGALVTQPRTGRRRSHCTSCRASRAKLPPNGRLDAVG